MSSIGLGLHKFELSTLMTLKVNKGQYETQIMESSLGWNWIS